MEEHKDIKFTETETFKKAKILKNRTEIARAFNLEDRIALKLTLDADDYEPGGFPIALAAPTGRAAKRMSEMIGLPASTIHRLLGLTG